MRYLFLGIYIIIPCLLFASGRGEHSIGVGIIVGGIFAIVAYAFSKWLGPTRPNEKHPRDSNVKMKFEFSTVEYTNEDGVKNTINSKQTIVIYNTEIFFSGYINQQYDIVNIEQSDIDKIFICKNSYGTKKLIIQELEKRAFLYKDPSVLTRDFALFVNMEQC